MKDRGMIKWQPFQSVVPTNLIVKSLLEEKKKVTKPVLSDDQLDNLDILLAEYFYNQSKIQIKYFQNNKVKEIQGIITNINADLKIVTISGHLNLHISQILQINT